MKKLIPVLLGHYLNGLAAILPRTAGRIGFRLFCRPIKPPMKQYHKAFLDSAEKSVFNHGKLSIQVYKWGEGENKILFLHGWQSHSFRWKNYIDSIPKDEYTIYALDAPGHGYSSGNFLTVPLYSEVIEKFVLHIGHVDAIVSHSLGAFTTLYTFHRHPLLPVRKLVFMASPGEANEFISYFQKALNLKDRTLELIIEHFEKVIQYPIRFFSAPAFATSVNIPGLIIHDENDDETPHHHSVRIHEAWSKSNILLTKGLGHNLRSPSIVNVVTEFITKGSYRSFDKELENISSQPV